VGVSHLHDAIIFLPAKSVLKLKSCERSVRFTSRHRYHFFSWDTFIPRDVRTGIYIVFFVRRCGLCRGQFCFGTTQIHICIFSSSRHRKWEVDSIMLSHEWRSVKSIIRWSTIDKVQWIFCWITSAKVPLLWVIIM